MSKKIIGVTVGTPTSPRKIADELQPVLCTPQTLTEAQRAQARRNLGITNTGATPIAYLYNGLELPPLPDWDKTAYPYAIITEEYLGRGYVLWVCSEVIVAHENWMDTGNTMLRFNGVTTYYRSWKIEDTEGWEEDLSGDLTDANDADGNLINSPVLWVNFDMRNQENALYLAASDPVPVYPGGGGGADWSPVVIDLDTYGGGGFETSITAVVLQLLNNGGGKVQNMPMGSLFSDLNTERPIRVQLSYPFSSTEFAKVIIDGVSTVRFDDYVESLYANVLFGGTGVGVVSVLVHLQRDGLIEMSILSPGADTSAIVADMEAILNAEY